MRYSLLVIINKVSLVLIAVMLALLSIAIFAIIYAAFNTAQAHECQIPADLNCDGEVNAGDAIIMQRHLAGLVTSYPLPTPALNPDMFIRWEDLYRVQCNPRLRMYYAGQILNPTKGITSSMCSGGTCAYFAPSTWTLSGGPYYVEIYQGAGAAEECIDSLPSGNAFF